MAGFDKKMAGYGDAMVAGVVQGFWTERSERSVLPTALSIIGVPALEKDLLGHWKPEGSDIYARSYGGRVAISCANATPKRPGRTTATWS